jgi:hypothetical protein
MPHILAAGAGRGSASRASRYTGGMNWKMIPGFLLALITGLLWANVVFTLIAVVGGFDRDGAIPWAIARSLIILSALASAATWGAYQLCRTK